MAYIKDRMKILLISDTEERSLWDNWNEATAKRLADVSFILSAGDLRPEYLEFLVTMLNVPLIYVRGNHDGIYDEKPPEGCENADGSIVEIECGRGSSQQKVRILGLGGSMRYNVDPLRVRTLLMHKKEINKLYGIVKTQQGLTHGRSTGHTGAGSIPAFDILLTHAPCRGYGDMEDLPHRGFECFNYLLNKYSPQLHCYGHVHQAYGEMKRSMRHPSGTLLINGSGYHIIDCGTL